MNIREYENEYFLNLERGVSRRDGIKRALDVALERQDVECAFTLYYKYIDEDIFYCDNFNAMIIFPEMLAFFEKHEEWHNEWKKDMMWAYKWIIENIFEFYQIPLEQIESIFQQFFDFCGRFGYSRYSYYQKYIKFYYNCKFVGDADKEKMKELYSKMLECKDDTLSDCKACRQDSSIWFALFIEDDLKKAKKLATPIFNGKMTCKEVPHVTYGSFIKYYFENGDLNNAKIFADKCIRVLNRDYSNSNNLLSERGSCILTYAYTDIDTGVKALRKSINLAIFSKSGLEAFEYYRACYHLMLQLEKQGKNSIHLKFTDKLDPIYNESGNYLVSVLKKWFYDKCKAIADKFDKRNGNDMKNKELAKIYEFDYSKYKQADVLNISVYEYIIDNIEVMELPNNSLKSESILNGANEYLPESFSLPRKPINEEGIRFADGAVDGITFFHIQPHRTELGELEEILRKGASGQLVRSTKKLEKYFENNEDISVLSIVDNLQQYILDNKEEIEANTVFRFALNIMQNSSSVNAVKLALCIMELFTNSRFCARMIKRFALCNEFTMYCVWVIRRWDNGNQIIFDIAKKVNGWGKIFAVMALEPETDEIKEWLLKKGWINDIAPHYSVLDVYNKIKLNEMLENGIEQHQLTAAIHIIAILLDDGPICGIKEIEESDLLISDLLDNAERLECSELDRKAIGKIGEMVENEVLKQRCKKISQ